ncbi:MAG: fibronectin type III domain-containing protein [Verrucomicrobiota bacterium]|jgi:hypothetical protein
MSLSLFARNALVCGCLAVAAPAVVFGQTNNYLTNGVEYAIAGSLPGDQTRPYLAINSAGGYLVWEDNLTDGDGLGISARQLDSTLSGTFSSFRVNFIGAGDQELPQVALLNSGGAVFVWQGGQRSYQHIYARFLSASGTWVTPASDVLVNTFTNNFQVNPAVAVLANGNVVVVWGSFNEVSASSLQDVYGQVLSPTGQKVGGEFLVNQYTSYNQRTPAIAGLSDGRFVVAWISEQERFLNSVDIYARIFNADGSSSANEIPVNTSTNVCANPSVAASPNGGFMIAWSEKDLTSLMTNSWDVYACAFLNTGVAAGPVVRLNQYLFGDQYAPKLASLGSDVLAVWTSLGQNGSSEGVVGRFLSSKVTPEGDEFLVNTTTIGPQIHPAVAADGQARFLVAWASFTGLAYGFDLFAQRYASTLEPLVAPGPPFVTVLSSNALTVSWPAVAGLNVADYEVYADGAATPTAVAVTNTWWTMTNLAPSSTHFFQLDYVLSTGRTSPLSGATTNTTYDTLTWGGIPYDWMTYYFGTDVWNWPSPYADSDGSGVSNLYDFLAGTCPTNAASALRIRLQPTIQGLFLNWNTQPGLIYQVQISTSLNGWTNLGGMRFAPGTVDSMYVGGSPASFYRVLRVR